MMSCCELCVEFWHNEPIFLQNVYVKKTVTQKNEAILRGWAYGSSPCVPNQSMDWPYLNVSGAGLFHCLQKRHAGMWLSVICAPLPSRKKMFIGFRNGELGGKYTTSNCLWLLNQFRIKTAWWKQTLSQTTTNLGCSAPSCWAASWSASRNVMICWVL